MGGKLLFFAAIILSITQVHVSVVEARVPVSSNDIIDTFHAKGTINSLASPNNITSTTERYLLSGKWNFDVINGTVRNFKINFIMGFINGSRFHSHSIFELTRISNTTVPLTANANTPTSVSLRNNYSLVFSGVADINTNRTVTWRHVPVIVKFLSNVNIINIIMDPSSTQHHFEGLPITGLITSLTDKNNNELRPLIADH